VTGGAGGRMERDVMALDFAPPRYAQLVTAIQDRITSGAYAPGALMPTESQLTAEFGVSRATVVRALQLLKADGWVESQQGRGTYVRAAPSGADLVRRGAELFTVAEPAGRSELLHAGPAVPPPAVAAVLGLAAGESAFLRRRLVTAEGEPVELVSAWFPASVAEGTDLDSADPLPEGTREHLAQRKRVSIERVTQRITARPATAEEARTLTLPRRVPVLDLLVTGHDSVGRPVQAVALVLPGDRHELEDAYSL
jgi:DNA-binding GntR family transcriptional regulator